MDGELWDLTDASGAPTGRTHRRGDPDFPAGLFHVVSSVCVVRDDGLVLMTKRAAVKDWPLAWEFPAGSALAGETSVEAAARELAEETGLRAASDALVLVGRHVEESALFDLYIAHGIDTDRIALDPEEVAAHEWVSLDEAFARCDAGVMAGPWTPRLTLLGPSLRRAVALTTAGGSSAD